MKSHNVIYFSGGPGWSSLPDQRILKDELSHSRTVVSFWSEPSLLRKNEGQFFLDRAFHHWMYSASEFLNNKILPDHFNTVVVHGFSSLPILKIILGQKLSVDQIIVISPYIDVYAYQRKIVSFSVDDFISLRELVRATHAKKLLRQSKTIFDAPIQQALQISFENPCLFEHFWQNPDVRDIWISCLSERDSQLDLMSWHAVNQDYINIKHQLILGEVSSIPLTIIYGEQDKLTDFKNLYEFWKDHFINLNIQPFSQCKHFPHLENPELFFNVLENKKSSVAA